MIAARAMTLALLIVTASPASAQDEGDRWTREDVRDAVATASPRVGCVIRAETGGTYEPYSVGRQGELGPGQLHPAGKLLAFRAAGFMIRSRPGRPSRSWSSNSRAGKRAPGHRSQWGSAEMIAARCERIPPPGYRLCERTAAWEQRFAGGQRRLLCDYCAEVLGRVDPRASFAPILASVAQGGSSERAAPGPEMPGAARFDSRIENVASPGVTFSGCEPAGPT